MGAKTHNQLDLKQWEHKHRFTIDIESNGTLLK